MPENTNNKSHAVSICCSVIVAIYVFCPVLLIILVLLMESSHLLPLDTHERVLSFFAPSELLPKAFRPFEILIEREVDFCNRYFPE